MSNSKGLYIPIVVDPSRAKRGFKETSTAAKVFGRDVDRALQNVDRKFTGVQSVTAGRGIAGGVIAGSVIAGVKTLTDAAANSQNVLGQTKVALEDTGKSWDRYGARIERVVAAQSKFGFDDEELLKTFSGFLRLTGDVDKALALNELSIKVARGRYIDLASAAGIVSKAQLGQAGALRRINIDAPKTASNLQLLALLERKYGNAAKSASGDATVANQRLSTSVGNLQEQVGSGLLPALTELADGLSTSTDNATSLAGALQKIKIPGLPSGGGLSIGNAIKAGLAATPGLNLTIGAGLLLKRLLPDKAQVVDAGEELGTTFGLTFLDAVRAQTKKAGPVAAGPSASLRNQWFDAGISRQLDRTQDIPTIAGQIGALQKIAAQIQRRIQLTKDITRKLNLEDQLVSVNRQIRGLQGDQASALADRIAAAKERQAQQAADRLERITSKEFRMLGLAADGNAVTPGRANLLKRIGTFEDNVRGTFLDTSKTKSELARFRKVLAEAMVPKEVRAKIDELLTDLGRQLRDGMEKKVAGPLTKTTALSSDRILAGLGLGPEARRELQARLSHFNSSGVALSGAGAGSMSVTVQAPDVYLDGTKISKSTSRQQTRTRKLNPPQRNGPNQGVIVY